VGFACFCRAFLRPNGVRAFADFGANFRFAFKRQLAIVLPEKVLQVTEQLCSGVGFMWFYYLFSMDGC